MAWFPYLRRVVLGGVVAFAGLAALPLLAQTDPKDAGSAPAAKPASPADNNPENYVPKKHKMSAEELGRLRMLEIKSGAYRDAKAVAQAQTMVGPPLSDREKVQHALNRLSFGAKPGEVEKILAEGGTTDQWQSWAKQQLDPDKIDDSEMEKQVASKFPFLKMSIPELKKKFSYKGEEPTWRVLTKELPEAVVMREVLSKRQFKEVMCEFWRNHFCVDDSPQMANPRSWAASHYEEHVIRPNVFGKFKTMLYASATHPAMLDYLDNRVSKANNWNENYARELMELHTLGADHGYNDQDVVELSKVLTGWNYDANYNFSFMANWHQPGTKHVMGQTVPEGERGGQQMLLYLANHKNTADFISLKLCKYLINDDPPVSLVQKISSTFTRTDGDLAKVYQAIIFSPEFMDRANYRAKFKTPVEFVVSAARSVDAKVTDTADVCRTLARMGEDVYNCPDPTGYYDRAEAWLDSGVLTSRWDFSWDLLRGRIRGITPSPTLLSKYSAIKGDERHVQMVRDLIGDDIGDRTRMVLKEANDANDVPRMISLLIGSPSFQQQ